MSQPDSSQSKAAESVQPDGEIERLMERLRASELQARHQSALLAAVLDSAPDIIFRIDREGVIRFANKFPAPLSVTGVVGHTWESLSPEDERPAMRAAVEKVFETGEPVGLERRIDTPDGVLWMSTRIAPIREGSKRVGAVIICRDVTDKKEAETQLLIADRMASVGTLAGGVAHEINNPLAALLANLDVIREDVKSIGDRMALPPDLSPALLETQSAAERIKAIVRDLKLFSQVDGERRGSVELHEILDSTLRMAGNEIRHRARLVRDYAKELPHVAGSEARLGQVFLNLVLNAAQAITEGHYDDNEIRVSTSLEPDGNVLVRVADTGMGIPPEIQKRLFTPFFTTKEVGIGTGLGLSVCQRIVAGLGGSITFSSGKGGTEFRVTLPAAPAPRRESPRSEAGQSAPIGKRRYAVLFIDDDAMVAHAARRVMSDHAITIASSAADALGLLAQGDRFDVIFCDLMMPQVTGMELFAELEKLAPEQARRVVFMTGGAYTPGATAFLDSVANRRVDKPFDLAVLQALIDEVAQRSE